MKKEKRFMLPFCTVMFYVLIVIISVWNGVTISGRRISSPASSSLLRTGLTASSLTGSGSGAAVSG